MLKIKNWTRGTDTIPAIDGRELHKALAVGRDFPTWINARLQYGYIENEDFTVCLVPRESGTPAKEYTLSLPMAAELCLLERSDTGRDLRRFILDQQSAQKCNCPSGNCADNKPMELLTLDDLESYRTSGVKHCPECQTPFNSPEELCHVCIMRGLKYVQRETAIRRKNDLIDVTVNELVQCLIERDGDTTMTPPGAYGAIYTFKRNSYGHAVCRIQNPVHRSNILKSCFYKSYVPPDEGAPASRQEQEQEPPQDKIAQVRREYFEVRQSIIADPKLADHAGTSGRLKGLSIELDRKYRTAGPHYNEEYRSLCLAAQEYCSRPQSEPFSFEVLIPE